MSMWTCTTRLPVRRVALAALAVALALLASPATAARVAIACGSVGIALQLCREGAAAWAAESGHEAEVVTTPADADSRFALYQQLLAARSDRLDVLEIDVIWPAALAPHLLDLRGHVPGDGLAGHLPVLVENSVIEGRLVALPWFLDVGLLYYRRDLLERHGVAPPGTWAELEAAAARIQAAERAAGNPRFWGYVFQGRSYEGLTCNALEWIAAARGGSIVDRDGRVTVDNPRAAGALDRAASWIGRIAPPGVLAYAEEDARSVFHSGNAAFMRNWPYAWALLEADGSPVRGRVGVQALPAGEPGGRRVGVLGGGELVVSRYSRHPAIAADLVRYLTAAAEQKRRAVAASIAPTRPALYEDPEILRANPFLGRLAPAVRDAAVRPVADVRGRYALLSSAFRHAVHAILSGQGNAAEQLDVLTARLKRLRLDR